MPTEDIRLRFEIEGQAAIQRAQRDVNNLSQFLRYNNQLLQQGIITQGEYDKAWQKTGARLRKAASELQALNEVANPSRGNAFSGMAGGKFMQIAYLADDIQYGMRGIANQLPMLGSLVGLSNNWAGALATVGTSLYVLYKALDDLEQLAYSFTAPDWLREMKEDLRDLNDSLNEGADAFIRWATAGSFGAPSLTIKRETTDTRKAEDEHAEEMEQTRKRVEGIKDQESLDRGHAFEEAIKSVRGGGKTVEQAMVQQALGIFEANKGMMDREASRPVRRSLDEKVRQPDGSVTTQRELLDAQAEELYKQKYPNGSGRSIGGIDPKQEIRQQLYDAFEKSQKDAQKRYEQQGPSLKDEVRLPGGRVLTRKQMIEEHVQARLAEALEGNKGEIDKIVKELSGKDMAGKPNAVGTALGEAYQKNLPEAKEAAKEKEKAG